jgi:hypothetical protein
MSRALSEENRERPQGERMSLIESLFSLTFDYIYSGIFLLNIMRTIRVTKNALI